MNTKHSLLPTTRRSFLKMAGITGGGLVVGVSLTACGEGAPALSASTDVFTPNAFLQITEDNQVRFYCPRDEMGQGVSTGLTTLVAEELDIDPQNIDVRFVGAHKAYDNVAIGMQITGGSTSMMAHYEQLRQVGANTRFVLLEAAAAELGVAKNTLTTENGAVIHGRNRYPYGDFARRAIGIELPEAAGLKPRSEFKYIGKEFARLDAMVKSTGTAVYGIDVEVDGMHHAVVRRSPVAGCALKSVDKSSVAGMAGVTDVVEIDSGVAVVAEKFWQAKKAAAALVVQWETSELSAVNTATVKADYQAALRKNDGDSKGKEGDLAAGFSAAKHVVEHEYWAPYLAHSPLEPMNAVLQIKGDKAELWSGTQAPGSAQGLVARHAGLDKDNVTVHTTYLGGGFGRRATLTHVSEAAQIAVLTNKPIKVVWTREDDIQNGYYRPASLMSIKGGIDEAGKITTWEAKRVGGNITPETFRNSLPGILPTAVPQGLTNWAADVSASVFDGWAIDHSSVEGLYEDYDSPNKEVFHTTVDHGLPLTFWRSVGHSYTAFAKESAVDELASVAGIDPIKIRLDNSQNNPRLNNVIKLVGDRVATMEIAEGHSIGIAAHTSFGSYVAQAAEVSVQNGKIKVHKVICAVDCGQIVNPDIVRGQMEGSIMFGLTAALHGEIDLQDGAVKQSNFHDYQILRMNESPAVETILVDSEKTPTGVGEPGLPPIAPAVANAVFAATGQRLRSLPLRLA